MIYNSIYSTSDSFYWSTSLTISSITASTICFVSLARRHAAAHEVCQLVSAPLPVDVNLSTLSSSDPPNTSHVLFWGTLAPKASNGPCASTGRTHGLCAHDSTASTLRNTSQPCALFCAPSSGWLPSHLGSGPGKSRYEPSYQRV